jgi:acyl-[acyl-carrier-protein]-phospholipid O-acyltransferase/long-chain-fatty-acid--[acyl-carrier-protein] ligase
MALFASVLGLVTPGFWGTIALMTMLGTCSGLLLVPLNALVQWKAPKDRRGSVIALSNVFQSFGMLAGTYAGGALARAGMSNEDILVAIAVVTVLGTLWALWVLPQAFLRLLLVLLTNSF